MKHFIRVEVREFLIKIDIHLYTELFFKAIKRKEEGKTYVTVFVLSKSKNLLMISLKTTRKCTMQGIPLSA